MAALYIASDRPGAGKTALASSLASRLSKDGKGVGYFKPFSNSPQEDPDVAFIGRHVLVGDDETALTEPLPLPKVKEAGPTIPKTTATKLKRSLNSLAKANEVVLVEGPSLLGHEGGASTISGEVSELLEARVVLIVHYVPGLDVPQVARNGEAFGERLLGVLINCVTRYREREVRLNLAPALEAAGIKVLGVMPEDRLMLSVTTGQLAEHLEGRWVLGEDKDQELVENYLIGGNIMDSGISYFGRADSKAVIVRGDRPDIQLASLATPTTCLVLTGGHEPNQYVYYQAQQQEVPLLVVQSDTITTSHALDTVLERCTCHHPQKLKRFQELLQGYADVDTILSAC